MPRENQGARYFFFLLVFHVSIDMHCRVHILRYTERRPQCTLLAQNLTRADRVCPLVDKDTILNPLNEAFLSFTFLPKRSICPY